MWILGLKGLKESCTPSCQQEGLNHRKRSVRLTHQDSCRRLKVSTSIVTKVYLVKSVHLFFQILPDRR